MGDFKEDASILQLLTFYLQDALFLVWVCVSKWVNRD